MEKQTIKNNEMQERAKYTPAEVKVLDFAGSSVICQSGGINNMTIDGDGGDNF